MAWYDWITGRKSVAPDEVIAGQSITVGQEGTPEWPNFNIYDLIQNGFEDNELIYACVRKIANTAAHANMILHEPQRGDEDLVEIEGPVSFMLNEPNAEDTQFDFLDYIHTSLQVAGNAYVFKERAGTQVVNLWPISPAEVTLIPGTRGVRGWKVRRRGLEWTVPPEDVKQLKFTSLSSQWFGMSPLRTAVKIANLDMSATEFSKVFFQNAGVPRGLLKLKRRLQGGETEAQEIRAKWRARMSGSNRHEIAVLDENAEYEKVGSNLDEIELELLRDLVESRICAAFGVPPIMVGANVGLKRGTYANYEEAREQFWQETVLPLYRRIGLFMTRLIREDFDIGKNKVGFDFSGVAALQESETEKAEAMRIKAQAAMILINSGFEKGAVLETVGLPEIEETEEPEPVAAPAVQPALPAGNVDDGGRVGAVASIKGLSVSEQQSFLRAQNQSFDDVVDDMERVVQEQFTKQVRTADSVMGRYINEESRVVKAEFPFDADKLIPPSADDDLIRAVRPLLLDVAARSWVALDGPEVLDHVPFDPEAPPIQQVLRSASERVVNINATTRKAINEILQEGTNRGLSIGQIARGVSEVTDEAGTVTRPAFRGIRSVIQETYKNRARTIARTEVKAAQNRTTAARYQASGVTFVEIRDGDEDAGCASVNGTRQTVEWLAENPSEHPNCTRGAIPVIEVQPALTGAA